MPRGSKGEKRPADEVGNAVHVVLLRTLPGADSCSTPNLQEAHVIIS